jgi:peptidoglycan/LPS O-acetylase OafA/YrhL
MEVKKISKPHLQSLTGLRFFAAIYVVLFHHGGQGLSGLPEYVGKFFRYGYVSVSLFFILSGFVLAYTYLDTKNESSIAIPRFWVARFARVYPLYLFALIVSAPAFISKLSELGAVRAFLTGISSLTLLQAWTPWTVAIWNTPTWAVSVEVCCYLMFPFVAIWINKLTSRNIIFISGILWLSSLIFPIANLLVIDRLLGEKSIWMTFIIYGTIFHVPQFLIGVCLGVIFLRKQDKLITKLPSYSQVALLTMGLAIAVCIVLVQSSKIPYELLNNGLLAPLFCLFIWTLSERRGVIAKLLSVPFLLLLGEASYAIYLLQNPWLSFLKLVVDKSAKQGLLSANFFDSFWFLSGYLLSLIAISIAALVWIEKPCRKYILSRFAPQQISATKDYVRTK